MEGSEQVPFGGRKVSSLEQLFALFDRLLILAPTGRVVYFGAASAAAAAFESVGRPIPPLWNPTDHYIECVGDEDTIAKLRSRAFPTGDGGGDGDCDDDNDEHDDNKLQGHRGDSSDGGGEDDAKSLLLKPASWAAALWSPPPSSSSSVALHPSLWAQVRHLARRGMLTSKGSALKPMEFVLCIGK